MNYETNGFDVQCTVHTTSIERVPYVCKSNRYLSTLQVVQTKRLRVFLDNRSSGLFLPTVRKCQKLQIRLNGRPPKNQMSPGSTTSPNFFSSFYLSLVEARHVYKIMAFCVQNTLDLK